MASTAALPLGAALKAPHSASGESMAIDVIPVTIDCRCESKEALFEIELGCQATTPVSSILERARDSLSMHPKSLLPSHVTNVWSNGNVMEAGCGATVADLSEGE